MFASSNNWHFWLLAWMSSSISNHFPSSFGALALGLKLVSDSWPWLMAHLYFFEIHIPVGNIRAKFLRSQMFNSWNKQAETVEVTEEQRMWKMLKMLGHFSAIRKPWVLQQRSSSRLHMSGNPEPLIPLFIAMHCSCYWWLRFTPEIFPIGTCVWTPGPHLVEMFEKP